MTHLSHDQVNAGTARQGGPEAKPAQSPHQVQMVVVGTLLFVVLSVIAEYVLGEFAGLNIGQDFGVILGGTIVFGMAVGLAVSAVHSWTHHPRGH